MKIQELQTVVARFYGLTRAELVAPGREQPRATMRLVAMALAARYATGVNRSQLAAWFGCVHNSSIEHAEMRVSEWRETDAVLANDLVRLEKALRSHRPVESESLWVRAWRSARCFTKSPVVARPVARPVKRLRLCASRPKAGGYVRAHDKSFWYGPELPDGPSGVGFGSLAVLEAMLVTN